MPRGSADGLRDEQLETMDIVSAGPLAERVLSALVEEKVHSEDKDQPDKDGDPVNSIWTQTVAGDRVGGSLYPRLITLHLRND